LIAIQFISNCQQINLNIEVYSLAEIFDAKEKIYAITIYLKYITFIYIIYWVTQQAN